MRHFYIPKRLNNTKPKASIPPTFLKVSVLRAGTKAAKPYQRKKSQRHHEARE
jgi:hypothetical protein